MSRIGFSQARRSRLDPGGPAVPRRALLIGAASALAALSAGAAEPPDPVERLDAIERRVGGRLGVAALDTGSGRRIEHRATERFAFCSTFKLLLAAAVLARVDGAAERLDRRIAYGPGDLLSFAPVTTAHVAEGGLTVEALASAAVEHSDNTAANLLLQSIGGPPALTRYARSIGDTVTRLDRTELALNTAIPGDPRDTTSPAAMLGDLRAVLLGTALSAASRERLQGWLIACETGAKRLRAGLPAGWRAGDKTGSGENAATNDVGILWPPDRAPILVAAYFTESSVAMAEREAVLADVGRVVAEAL